MKTNFLTSRKNGINTLLKISVLSYCSGQLKFWRSGIFPFGQRSYASKREKRQSPARQAHPTFSLSISFFPPHLSHRNLCCHKELYGNGINKTLAFRLEEWKWGSRKWGFLRFQREVLTERVNTWAHWMLCLDMPKQKYFKIYIWFK